jgi:hypothetical protein
MKELVISCNEKEKELKINSFLYLADWQKVENFSGITDFMNDLE